jgi:hypothetical protein
MTSANDRLTIIVAGMVGNVPGHGGATWAVLQYLLGLRRLGHRVHFVEFIDRPQLSAPEAPFHTSRNSSYCGAVFGRFDLTDEWTLVGPGGAVAGTSMAGFEATAGSADLLVDLSGCATGIEAVSSIPRRLYVDMDPGFTQWWHAQGANVGLEGHTHYATVGTAIPHGGTAVPSCGVVWWPMLPPVVLDLWPRAGDVVNDAFTTVGNWRSYGPVDTGDTVLGQRAHSFRAMARLPALSGERFTVALSIHEGDAADRSMLEECGWQIVDPATVAATPDDYQRFVAGSYAEIGIAKHGYVSARTGWFSDRSAVYLACGRPVLAQDTGMQGGLPVGTGLVTFSNLQEAAEATRMIRRDYRLHSSGARGLALDHLDSDRILGGLVDMVFA